MLAVMDALADQEQVTHRELSRKTGLNLKKANYCPRKLLGKGFVKFQRPAPQGFLGHIRGSIWT